MQNIQIPLFIKISTCNISLQYSVLLLLGKMFYYFLTLNSRHPVRKKTRQYPFPMTSHNAYLSSRFLYVQFSTVSLKNILPMDFTKSILQLKGGACLKKSQKKEMQHKIPGGLGAPMGRVSTLVGGFRKFSSSGEGAV